MSPFLDVSLVATTVAVVSKLSLDLDIGLEACTTLSEFTLFTIEGLCLFGSSKASLPPGVVSSLSVETNEAIVLQLELSAQLTSSRGAEKLGPISGADINWILRGVLGLRYSFK